MSCTKISIYGTWNWKLHVHESICFFFKYLCVQGFCGIYCFDISESDNAKCAFSLSEITNKRLKVMFDSNVDSNVEDNV